MLVFALLLSRDRLAESRAARLGKVATGDSYRLQQRSTVRPAADSDVDVRRPRSSVSAASMNANGSRPDTPGVSGAASKMVRVVEEVRTDVLTHRLC